MLRTRPRLRPGVALAALLSAAAVAPAQTNGTWIGVAGGNWSTATNWLGGTIPDGGGIATFNNLTGQLSGLTATIDTTRTLGQINYDTGYSFTIAGSGGQTLTMGSGGLTLNAINSLRSSPTLFFTTTNNISAVISGSGDLVKTGAGNVALTGANTFTGTVQVNQGALWANGGDGVFGNTANGVTINGGVLGVNTTGGFTSNRTYTIGANGGTFQTFTALTLGGTSTLTGSGTLIKQLGNANLLIGGTASGFTGKLQIEGGGLTLLNAAALGGSADVDLAGVLTLDNAGTNTNNRLTGRTVVARGGTFAVTGNATAATTESVGTMTLAQGNTFVTLTPNAAQATTLTVAGVTRQNNATLFVRGTGLGAAPAAGVGNLVVTQDLSGQLVGGGGDPNGGTTASILPWAYGNTSAANQNGSSFVTQVAGGRIVPLNLAGGYATTLTVGSTTQDNVDLAAGLTVSAATTINALRLAPAANLTVDGTAPLTVTSGAVLNTSTAATAPTVTISAPLTAGSRELVLASTNGTANVVSGLVVSGAVSGTGGLTKTGNGVVALTGANTYTGATTLAGGFTVVGTSTVTADGSAPSVFGQATSAIVQLSTGANSASRLWAAGNLTLNRDLTVVLGGGGTTGLGNAGAGANESVVVNGNIALTNPTGSTTNGFYALEGGTARANAVTVNGVVSGAGGLRSNFGGYSILNNTNTYTGGTLLGGTGGQTGTGTAAQPVFETWEVGADGALGTGTVFWASVTPAAPAQPVPAIGTLVSAGAGSRTLANPVVLVSGLARFDGPTPLTLTGPVELNGSAQNLSYISTASAGTRVTISGALSRGGFAKDGPGTLTLTGINTHTGQTFVRQGVLGVGTIGNGGTAGNLGGAPAAASYLTLSGNDPNAPTGALRYTGGGETTNRGFSLAGTGGTLDASGSGPLTLTGSVAMNTPIGSGSIGGATFVANAGVIALSTTFAAQMVVGSTLSGNANIPAGTTITEVGSAYIRLSTATTNAAAATAQSFTVTLPAAVTSRTLTLTGSNTGLNTLAPVLANGSFAGLTLAVAKTGPGTWQLTGNNTYSGGTTVGGGTLVVNNPAGSGTGTGAVTVNSGGTLAGGSPSGTVGTISGAVTVNAGGRLAPGTPGASNGVGTLTVANNVTVTGGTGSTWAVPLAAVAPNTPATAEAGGANVSQLRLTGAASVLNLVSAPATPLTVAVANPTGSSFTLYQPVSYVIGTVATGGNIQTNGGAFAFDPAAFTFTATGFQAESFALSVDGGTRLVLTFTPVPEPATVFGIGVAVVGLVGGARRWARRPTV